MTPPQDRTLEEQLAELTQWHGPAPQVWRKALRAAGAGDGTRGLSRIIALIRARPIISAMAACIALAAIGTSVWQLQSPTSSRPVAGRVALESASPHDFGVAHLADVTVRTGVEVRGQEGELSQSYGLPSRPAETPATRGAERQVVRKVTIQLTTPDVRGAYLRAGHLISQAKGEFVQDSALTGSGNALEANLTLRVAADRLPEVLDQLRELGKVESEQANGEDVTEQAVDLEARLNNERRVETELQNLLESRTDAPLKEILELRDKLREVRESIERLTAQRSQLSRLVNLATVLVLIRPADATLPAKSSIGEYFAKAISTAWHHSLRFLADTVAMFVAVLVGGFIWWMAVILLIIVALRYRKRDRVPRASERA